MPGSGRVWRAVPDALHGTWFACVTWLILSFVSAVDDAEQRRADDRVDWGMHRGRYRTPPEGDRRRRRNRRRLLRHGRHECRVARLVRRARSSFTSELGVALAAILMIGFAVARSCRRSLLDRYRDSIAPDLVRFDSPHVCELVSSNSVVADRSPRRRAGRSQVRCWESRSRQKVARRLVLTDPIPDWRRYSTLDVDVFVEGRSPMPITISMRLDHASVDHVYQTVHLRARTVSSAVAVRRSVRPRGGARERGGDLLRARPGRSHVLPRPRRTSRVDCVEPSATDTRWPRNPFRSARLSSCVRGTVRADLDEDIDEGAAAVEANVIGWHRDIHKNPELSNREVRTAALVASYLKTLGHRRDDRCRAHRRGGNSARRQARTRWSRCAPTWTRCRWWRKPGCRTRRR